jgi:hypothetical protein
MPNFAFFAMATAQRDLEAQVAPRHGCARAAKSKEGCHAAEPHSTRTTENMLSKRAAVQVILTRDSEKLRVLAFFHRSVKSEVPNASNT